MCCAVHSPLSALIERGAGKEREGEREIRLPDNGDDQQTLVLPEGQQQVVRALAARPKAERWRPSGKEDCT